MNEAQRINFYSIKDVGMNFFCPPFLANSDDDAKRMVRDSIEPNSVLSRFPRDYHLYRVGSMNSRSGIDNNDLLCICSVNDLVRPEVLAETTIPGEEDKPGE